MVSAIVLSAGSSNRMGTPKGLLKIGDKTFLRHIVDVLHSSRVLDVAIVLGSGAETIEQTLDWFDGKIVTNEEWERGQLSSIIAGLGVLEQKDLHGVMICPVDRPFISQSLIVDLLQAFWKSKKKIIVPVYGGQRGHPVIFSIELFEELRNAPLDIGARAVVHAHPEELCEVRTDEEGITINIDTPEDYDKYIVHQV
jgi:molybdenum cofactor cytidylyltransferase